jgi:hypothetical protein
LNRVSDRHAKARNERTPGAVRLLNAALEDHRTFSHPFCGDDSNDGLYIGKSLIAVNDFGQVG